MWQICSETSTGTMLFALVIFSGVHKVALQTANWRCTVTDFMRENMDHYVRHSEMYMGISGPQSSNKDLTSITDIFEQTVEWYVVHKMWMGQNTMHRNSKILQAIFLSSGLEGKWVAAHDTKKNTCIGTFPVNWYSTAAQCVTAFLIKPGGSHPTCWFRSFLGQIWSICRFKHIKDISKDTHLRDHENWVVLVRKTSCCSEERNE